MRSAQSSQLDIQSRERPDLAALWLLQVPGISMSYETHTCVYTHNIYICSYIYIYIHTYIIYLCIWRYGYVYAYFRRMQASAYAYPRWRGQRSVTCVSKLSCGKRRSSDLASLLSLPEHSSYAPKAPSMDKPSAFRENRPRHPIGLP